MVLKRADFKYYEMSGREKERLLEVLRRELEAYDSIIFAYIHGGFLERSIFRDIDVAVWIRDPGKAFYYEVDLPAMLEVKLGIPVDIHVLNEAPLAFKYHVFTKGKLLFSRDNNVRAEVIDETIREYMDVRLLYETLKKNLAQKN